MKLLLLLIALCCSTVAYSQASWTYRVGFALNDKDGQPLSRQDLLSGRYQLFTDRSNGKFEYAETLGLFCLTGSSITWFSMHISLTNGRDSTVVILPISSARIILTNWPTKPGVYTLELDSGKIGHPQAILYYPTQFKQNRGGDARLFTLTVLDWSKYLSTGADSKKLKDYFEQREKVKP